MPSFVPKILEKPVPHEVVLALGAIHRGRGKQELYKERAPEMLENLRKLAAIESTESSNRIEGVIVSRTTLQRIVENKVQPAPGNRSQGEVAGYREVIGLIHERHEHMPFTPGVVRQLHRDLYKYAGGHGGRWKISDNEITEELPDGRKIVRFHPVRAFKTAGAMDELHERFSDAFKAERVDSLILDALYVLDFLCIHPFSDGNGRMSRLLTVMLLQQQGFEVGRYVSIERLIEQTKESYYETLGQSSEGWHDGAHDPMPWVAYMLSVVRAAYDELATRVDELKGHRGAKTAFVLQAIEQSAGDFSVAEIHGKVPSVGVDMVRKVLKDEKAAGRVISLGRGRGARWRRVANEAKKTKKAKKTAKKVGKVKLGTRR